MREEVFGEECFRRCIPEF